MSDPGGYVLIEGHGWCWFPPEPKEQRLTEEPQTFHAGERRTDHDEFRALVDAAARLVGQVSNAGHTLIDHAYMGQPDGYPRVASGRERQPPTTVLWCDEHQQDLRDCRRAGQGCDGVPVDTLADPTGETVLERHEPLRDELVQAKRQMLKLMGQAVDRLSSAVSWTAVIGKKPAEPADMEWCSSCKRVNAWSPRWRGDLCRWCYDHRDTEGNPPPEQLVDWHNRGRRITSNDWARYGYRVA